MNGQWSHSALEAMDTGGEPPQAEKPMADSSSRKQNPKPGHGRAAEQSP